MDFTSIIDTLQRCDQNFTLWLNSFSSPISDQFWQLMSDKTFWFPAYAICAIFLFKRLGWKKALIVLGSVILAFGICDQLSNLVKYSVLRLRPSYSIEMLHGRLNLLESRGSFFGFFSAHAANAFAMATCLTIGFRNDLKHTYNFFWKGAMLWAGLVAVSRIFVGKHYFGDVLVGTIIGLTVGYFIGMLARYIIQKYLDKTSTTGLTFALDKKKPSITLESPSPSGSPVNPSQAL